MDIHVSSTPPHLRLTETMLCDFLCDPVLAAYWLTGVELDSFQKFLLKMEWWVPEVLVESGISTGKTLTCDWIYSVLRACLIPNYGKAQDVGVYFYTFQMGKDTYWKYFRTIPSPMLRAQMGDVDDPDRPNKQHDPSCWKAKFKSGGEIAMPAADVKNQSGNQASRRFNTVIFEEWTKFDASGSGNAINSELIGRRTAASWNKHHPLWANHTKFCGHAETRGHPSQVRYDSFRKRIRKGDPSCAIITASFKDFSSRPDRTGRTFAEQYRDDTTMATERANLSEAEFVAKCLGYRMEGGKGRYSEDMTLGAQEQGRTLGLLPCLDRREFERRREEGERA